jgi:hypothetical protein
MMKSHWIFGIALVLAAAMLAACSPAPTPTPALLPTDTPEPAATLPPATSASQPTNTSTPLPTLTPTPSLIGPFSPVPLGEDRPSDRIRDWRIAPDGTLWVSSLQELASYSQGTWTTHPPLGDMLLGFDDAGRLWVTFEDGASIAAWDGVAWTVYGPQAGWAPAGPVWRSGPHATVGEDIITDERGWVWLVTQQDVRIFNGQTWTFYSPEEAGFEPSEEMRQEGFGFILKDIAIDSVGDIWVSDCAWMGPGPKGQGARWFTGTEWQGQRSSVVSSGCIEDIEVDSAGRIWLGVDGDLWRYTPGVGWFELPHPEHDPDWGNRWGWISDIVLSEDDTAWVTMSPCGGASCDVGAFALFTVRDDTWSFVSAEGPADLAFDSRGEGWLCVGDGLYHLVDNSIGIVFQQEGFSCQVEADASGRVWMTMPDHATFWLYDAADID